MPVAKVLFNSSLPRAGSTLLQNILAQNPRFYCSPTSAVVALLYGTRFTFGEAHAFKAQDAEVMERGYRNFLRRGLEGFYEGITDRPVCVDKGRRWLLNYEWLETFYPKPKMLVCVRDLRAIASSMEKLWRKRSHLRPTTGFNPAEPTGSLAMLTIANRVVQWMNTNPLGVGAMGVSDAIQRGLIKKVHVLRFEDLTIRPKATMQKVYAYLDEPYFDHDFNNVEQVTQEDDSQFELFGDHNIRRKVEPVPLDYNDVLGKEVASQIVRNFPDYYRTFYPERLAESKLG